VVSIEDLLELFTCLDRRCEGGPRIELEGRRQPWTQSRGQRLDMAVCGNGPSGDDRVADPGRELIAIDRSAQKQGQREHAELQDVGAVIDHGESRRVRTRNAKLAPISVLGK